MAPKRVTERINIFLYDTRKTVSRALKIGTLLVSVTALSVLVYYYGFPQTQASGELLLNIIKGTFGFFIVNFAIKTLYATDSLSFLRKNWFEAFIMLVLTVEGFSDIFFDTLIIERFFVNLGFISFSSFSALFVQIYFLVLVITNLGKPSDLLPNVKMHPANIFILAFLSLILGGTFMLMLPEMTTVAGSMNFIDALFTSTSATCVTGLAVEDTATFFSFKGHMVILVLIQLGGLNIIAFGAFLALAAKFGLGIKQHSVIEDFVNRDVSINAVKTLGKIIRWSLMIELVGAALLYLTWSSEIPFTSTGDKIFSSIFHSVSAFNNAGLSTFTDGLFNPAVRTNYLPHLIVTVVVFFGALGFMSIFDLFDPARLRERMNKPWRHIDFSTKISLYFSLVLVLIGLVGFYWLEYGNTLDGLSPMEAMITSLFQSVTRTSGFNTVDIGSMTIPMTILMIFLMFVGSSSSSTGGGIKTSTFAVIYASVLSTMQGKERTELYKKTISKDLTYKAFSVLVFFVTGNLIAIFILSITESELLAAGQFDILDLIFEEVSAMGTVGLSTGVTPHLTTAGKIIVSVSMFVGRVGTLTVAYTLGKRLITKEYKYPYGHTMIG